MGLRSRYREKSADKNNTSENTEPEKSISAISPEGNVRVTRHESDEPVNEAVAEAMQQAAVADEAAARLKREVERTQLAHAGAAQRYQPEPPPPAPAPEPLPSGREERLDYWKRHSGMNEATVSYLRQHPKMIDEPRLFLHAVNAAANAGYDPNSPAFGAEIKNIFDRIMGRLEAAQHPQPPAEAEIEEPPELTPHFPEVSSPEERASAIVSAPVSREVPSASGVRHQQSPSSVRLSPAQLDVARSAGISPAEYAKHLIRLEREKASGERQL